MQGLEKLQQKCKAWQVVAHAKVLASEEKVTDGMREMQLSEDGLDQSELNYLSSDAALI